jgi:DNA repair protein RecN (Recombination protein N)
MNTHLFLKTLSLNNFATFQNQEIEFDDKLNVIVGETGSGKSLIFDSLQILLGFRADKKFVRKDCDCATIEATFCSQDPEINNYLENIGYPIIENEIVIKRIIFSNGKTKNFINFQSCTLQDISNFSKRFVDFVGQFENQKLLSPNYQLKLIDSFSKNQDLMFEYRKSYSNLKDLLRKKLALNDIASLEFKKDYLISQIKEIKSLNPTESDEQTLIERKSFLINKEKVNKSINEIKNLIDGNDQLDGLISNLKSLSKLFSDIRTFFPKINFDNIELLSINLSELSYEVSRFNDHDELELGLNEILEKLDTYQKLKRKFNCSTTELNTILSKLENDLTEIETLISDSETIDAQINKINDICLNLASKLHKSRIASSLKLETELTQNIQSLNMKGAEIKININQISEFNDFGNTQVNIIAQTNPGEGFYSIKEIASGGELSRILLALRSLFSFQDTISVFLFDEIDTGLGGETANSIGKSLKRISTQSQVITISHLPQIASFADRLIIVDKETSIKDNQPRTYSIANIIKGKEVKDHVSNMVKLFN